MNLSTPRPVADTGAAPDWDRVRLDFPLLMREVHGKPLVLRQRQHRPEAGAGDRRGG